MHSQSCLPISMVFQTLLLTGLPVKPTWTKKSTTSDYRKLLRSINTTTIQAFDG